MKKSEFVGKSDYYRRFNCSCYDNPAYYAEFIGENGETLRGRAASNAARA